MNTQNKVRPQLNVAVIGAGIAGLSAASQLLAAGASVTLIEKSKTIGGRASTQIKDGFYLNLGPHALYQGGKAYKFLKTAGVLPAGAPPKPRRTLLVVDGQLLELSLTGLLFTHLLTPREKLQMMVLMARFSKLDLDKLNAVSVTKWLDGFLPTSRLRDVVKAFVRLSTYSNSFDSMSAGAALKQVKIATEGVIYLDHGWNELVRSFHSLCVAHASNGSFGGQADDALPLDIRRGRFKENFDCHVESIFPTANFVTVNFNGSSSRFDAVIMAVPPAVANQLLPESMKQPAFEQIQGNHAACLDVCLKKLPLEDNTFAIGADESLYYSVHSKAAKLTDQGELIHLAVYLKDGETGSEKHEQRLYALLDQLQPRWREQLVFKRFLPNMAASFGSPTVDNGNCNGVASVALDTIPRTFVCGDWVGRGHMLVDAAVASALDAANAVLQLNSIDEAAREPAQKVL